MGAEVGVAEPEEQANVNQREGQGAHEYDEAGQELPEHDFPVPYGGGQQQFDGAQLLFSASSLIVRSGPTSARMKTARPT